MTWVQPVDGSTAAMANPLQGTAPTTATTTTTGSTANPVHDTQEYDLQDSNQSGWTRHWHAEHHRPFWTNDATRESTWNQPDDMST